MQVARFDFITVSGEIHVCGSAKAVDMPSDSGLVDDGKNHFYCLYENDLLIVFTIGDHVADLQIDIRLNETVPPADYVLLCTQVPFRLTGDDVLVFLYCEAYNAITIPPGNYVLTIHQFYSGEKPLGLPEDSSEIPLDERWKWDEVPTCLTMYFNPVDLLDGIEAKERWNRPDVNNWTSGILNR